MKNFWKELPKPFTILAPMDDVTDVVFRDMVTDIAKPDVLFTEFVSCDGLFYNRKVVERKLLYTLKQRPVVAQVWGVNPEIARNASKIISELGFDGIDINMGCPDKSVIRKGAGAASINNFSLAAEIINSVKQGAGSLPISIKTRIGFDKIMTPEWVIFLLEQNLNALTLHGRTAKQMSKGKANWEEIGKAVEIRNKIAPDTVIIGNGDVKSFGEVLEKHKTYGVDGVMIGRGIFSNPWVFEKNSRMQSYSKKERVILARSHLELFTKTWGVDKNFNIMKKFFKMYINGFEGANELRQRLMECRKYEDALDILEP